MVFTMLPELEMIVALPGINDSRGASLPTAPTRTPACTLMAPSVLQPMMSCGPVAAQVSELGRHLHRDVFGDDEDGFDRASPFSITSLTSPYTASGRIDHHLVGPFFGRQLLHQVFELSEHGMSRPPGP